MPKSHQFLRKNPLLHRICVHSISVQFIRSQTSAMEDVGACHPMPSTHRFPTPWNPKYTHSNTILYTYLNADENPRCLATRSKTNTSFPCSCKRNVFASTSRKMRLKCSLSTRNRWQLFSFSTIVAALKNGGGREREKKMKRKEKQAYAHTQIDIGLICLL